MFKLIANKLVAIADEKIKQQQEKTKQIVAETESKTKIIANETETKTKILNAETSAKLIEIAEREKQIPKTVGAEAAAVVNRAEQIAVLTKNSRRYGWIGAGLLLAPVVIGATIYGLDYLWNGNDYIIRKRVRYALTRGKLKLEDEPKVSFENTKDLPLQPQFLPTLLIAPTGAGKSTLLSNIARNCRAKNIPVIYLSIRGDVSDDAEKKVTLDEVTRLNTMTTELLNKLNYPTREAWILSKIEGINSVTVGSTTIESSSTKENHNIARLEQAFRCLSDVCDELKTERKSRYGDDASPILLLDEFHDLLKDSKVANVGGRTIFKMFARKIVDDGVTANRFRTVMAGSSGNLVADVDSSKISNRWLSYYLEDPSEADVKVELVKKGYTEEECKQIFALVGTRLRLLSPIFISQVKLPVIKFLEDCTKRASRNFDTVFKSIKDKTIEAELIRILDSLSQEPDKIEYTVSFSESIQKIDLYKLLYVLPEKKGEAVKFQSKLIYNEWSEWKQNYLMEKNKFQEQLM